MIYSLTFVFFNCNTPNRLIFTRKPTDFQELVSMDLVNMALYRRHTKISYDVHAYFS